MRSSADTESAAGERILRGSGITPENAYFIEQMSRALPKREVDAIKAWIGTFYGYQQNWLLDRSRFSMLLKCRQIGASHAYAAAALLWAIWGEQTSVVSVGEREAVDVVKKAALHARALCTLGSKLANHRATTLSVTLASGGTVVALPSSNAGRGKSGNVILDEAAYYERPEEIWDAAAATVMRGYRMRILSTPNGTGNLFHELWNDSASSAGFRKHRVTLDDARADGLEVNDAECWTMARGDPRVFDQLFRCKFLDGELQYISSELIKGADVEDAYCYEGETFAGLDIGRTADRTVLIVLRRDADGIFWLQELVECKRTSQDDIERIVAAAFEAYGIRRLCVDSTGMGAFPAERLQKKYGRHHVEPVTFTQGSKEDLATTLYQAFVERRMRIARSEKQLRDDIAALRRIITAAGNVRYDAPHTAKGHADSAWALALAVHAGTSPGRKKHVIEGGSGNEVETY